MDRHGLSYPQLAARVFNRPWAIEPTAFQAVVSIFREHMLRRTRYAGEIEADLIAAGVAARAPAMAASGAVRTIPIYGVLANRADMITESSGMTSYESIGKQFDAAMNDVAVTDILFDVDSPGGTVEGLQELSAKIYAARGTKRMTAIANPLAASAALYLATSAERFYVTPSGMAGSVGTIAEHLDFSEAMAMEGVKATLITSSQFKAEGNPYEPLGDEAAAELQRVVDDYGARFVNDLARNRGTQAGRVRADYGQGRMLLPDEAVRAGMADGVKTYGEVLASMGVIAGPGAARQASHWSVDLRQRMARLNEVLQ